MLTQGKAIEEEIASPIDVTQFVSSQRERKRHGQP
jgi:hypothetical protein